METTESETREKQKSLSPCRFYKKQREREREREREEERENDRVLEMETVGEGREKRDKT